MRYADPVAQAEIDRLTSPPTWDESNAGLSESHSESYRLGWRAGRAQAQAEIDRLRACSDPTPPAEGRRHSAEQMWHHLLEAPGYRRIYVLNQFLEAQDDALRCFLEHDEVDV